MILTNNKGVLHNEFQVSESTVVYKYSRTRELIRWFNCEETCLFKVMKVKSS